MNSRVTKLTRLLAEAPNNTTTQALLTTVFGDALLPRQQATSVVDLAMLVAPLGVNERSVRTALLRLSREDIVVGARQGRHSLYSVAAGAIESFERAEIRIYGDRTPPWDGAWTLVILDQAADTARRAKLRRELRWIGMAPLQTGVFVSPTISTRAVEQLADEHGVCITALFRSALFAGQLDGDPQLAEFADPTGQLHELHEAHIEKWAPISAADVDPQHSFALRTLLLDDWRQIALRSLAAPRTLLPDTWLGDAARSVTLDLYDELLAPSEQFLNKHLGNAESARQGFAPIV